jgi:hypothetical protein
MELQQRWGKEWDQDAAAAFQRDMEDYLTRMINEKHAPLMIPRVMVDPSTTAFTIVAGGYDNQQHYNSFSTTSTSLTDVVNYTGRGVLQRLVVAEKTSGGAAANNVVIDIVADGTTVLSQTTLTTQMTMRVIVGGVAYVSTSVVHVLDDSIGIPFNSSLRIRISTAAGTVHVGYKIAKKL